MNPTFMAALGKALAGIIAALGLVLSYQAPSGNNHNPGKNLTSVASPVSPRNDEACPAGTQLQVQPAVNTVGKGDEGQPADEQGGQPSCRSSVVSSPASPHAPDTKADQKPLWELVHPSGVGRLYTVDANEVRTATSQSHLTLEPKPIGMLSRTSFYGAIPMYRFRMGAVTSWIDVVDPNEKAKLEKDSNFTLEGVTGYLYPQAGPGVSKLVRLHKGNEWRLALESNSGDLVKQGYALEGPMGYIGDAPAGITPPVNPPAPASAAPAPADPAAAAKATREKHCVDAGSRFRWDANAKGGEGACLKVTQPKTKRPVHKAPQPPPSAPVANCGPIRCG